MINNILRSKKELKVKNEESTKTTSRLQDHFLEDALKKSFLVRVHLVNGVKLTGKVLSFDTYTIKLSWFDKHNNTKCIQIVYKHAIASIVKTYAEDNHEDTDEE